MIDLEHIDCGGVTSFSISPASVYSWRGSRLRAVAPPGKARQVEEHRPAFRKTVKWRTGSEGRISSLKRGYGWDRTRLDGTEGARIWTGQGVFAHNLVKIGSLAD